MKSLVDLLSCHLEYLWVLPLFEDKTVRQSLRIGCIAREFPCGATPSLGVSPLCRALIWSGVLKSGSPTLRLITSMPLARSSLLFCDIAIVAEGSMAITRLESMLLLLITLQIQMKIIVVLTYKGTTFKLKIKNYK